MSTHTISAPPLSPGLPGDSYLDAFVESMPDMVWVKDVSGVFLKINSAVERFFGVPREQIIGKTDFDFVDPKLAEHFRAKDLAAMQADEAQVNQEWLTFASETEPRLFETKKTLMRDAQGKVLGVLGVARDITEHNAVKTAQETLNRALMLIGKCNHAMMHATDERALLFRICQLAVDVGGYRVACVGLAEANADKSVSIAAWSQNGEAFSRKIHVSWAEDEAHSGTIGSAIRSGATVVNRDYRSNPAMLPWRALAEEYGLRSSIAVPLTQNGAVFGALMICSERPDAFGTKEQLLLEEMAADLAFGVQTQRTRAEHDSAKRQLEFNAHHDALTGTPNRVVMRENFSVVAGMARNSGASVAVLLLDLDNFKFVNDNLGHEQGDRLLIEVTRKLRSRVRGNGTVYRYGGDEFVVLLHPVCDLPLLDRYMRKLIDSFSAPVTVGDGVIDITVSAGVSLFPAHAGELDDLLRFADTALQKSKRSGKNTFHVFDETMQSAERQLVELRSQLRMAIRNDELVLHFQPKIDVASGRVTGGEALVRWQHPQRRLLGPAAFVPLAESTGIIVQIGDWVINEACRHLALWLKRGLPLQSVSVNVSALQVRRGNLLGSVANALRRWQVPAGYVELELTESIFLDDVDHVVDLLTDLRRLGVKISIDDFGTGYSSLAYLKTLHVDRLKVDQTFTRDLVLNPNALAIVKTIVQLGRNLDLSITAEGVENAQQLGILRELGCEEAQGYLFSRPVDAPSFEAFCLANVATLSAWK
jgi:diguanylate cyclase (GGDEF)-like protein/PAS domain S-box-containing protein